jgi:hypothetical protein
MLLMVQNTLGTSKNRGCRQIQGGSDQPPRPPPRLVHPGFGKRGGAFVQRRTNRRDRR